MCSDYNAMSYYIIIITIIIIIVLVVLSQGEVKDLDKKKTRILGFAPLLLWLKANHLTFLTSGSSSVKR